MEKIIERAKKIKLLILDVDGVLTDGQLYYDADGNELKAFHVHDGLGIKLLQRSGIAVAIITSRNAPSVAHRMANLGVEHVYQGQSDKLAAYRELLQKLTLAPEQVAYAGDDLIDLPLLKQVGLSIAVANANAAVLTQVHWITSLKGGEGAVREVCELLLKAQNHWQQLLAQYTNA